MADLEDKEKRIRDKILLNTKIFKYASEICLKRGDIFEAIDFLSSALEALGISDFDLMSSYSNPLRDEIYEISKDIYNDIKKIRDGTGVLDNITEQSGCPECCRNPVYQGDDSLGGVLCQKCFERYFRLCRNSECRKLVRKDDRSLKKGLCSECLTCQRCGYPITVKEFDENGAIHEDCILSFQSKVCNK